MAVTIDEMHVEVKEAPAQGNSPASNADPKKDVNLNVALDLLHERKRRLQAD
jgi:hypothetical protein